MTEFQITQRGNGYAPDIASVDGFDFDVHSEPDPDSSPTEYECYDAEDIAAFNRGDWHYVGITVTASIDGIELGSASMWAIGEGYSPGWEGYANPFYDEAVRDLAHEALAEARVNAHGIAHVISR